jgi:hypothetical protein
MTAHSNTRTDFTILDQQITRALDALRVARSLSSKERTQARVDAERLSEQNLNALLDHRQSYRQC